jgi:hypothetical protein
MRRLRCRAPAARPPRANGVPLDLLQGPAPQVRQRHDVSLELGEARCPVCHFPLVARMGPRGPHFPCRCRPSG